MKQSPSENESTTGPDFAGVIDVKRAEQASITQADRIAELSIVCRDAAAQEYCQRRAGKLPYAQAPWPASTIEFLRKHARKFHER